MEIDRRAFIASLGGAAVVEAMSSEAKAEALEHHLSDLLDAHLGVDTRPRSRWSRPRPKRRCAAGQGSLFTPQGPANARRCPSCRRCRTSRRSSTSSACASAPAKHVLQSANRAQDRHDREGHPRLPAARRRAEPHQGRSRLVGRADDRPYVDEKIAWAISYHQALRFYPDASVGYEYPELYVRIYGQDYVPPPYIEAAYKEASNHKWYMEARLITLNDLYAFDPNVKCQLDPFIDMIGRNFRQPKEGLGFDNSPTAHMWRTMMFPTIRSSERIWLTELSAVSFRRCRRKRLRAELAPRAES